jgi:hypothetical protein
MIPSGLSGEVVEFLRGLDYLNLGPLCATSRRWLIRISSELVEAHYLQDDRALISTIILVESVARDRNRSTTVQPMSLTRSLIPQQHRPILGQAPPG